MSATERGGPSQMFKGSSIKGKSTPGREAMFVDNPEHVYDIVIRGGQ